ncbi:MAG: AAA family ATPase [Candidatus Paceibacterota bacterium]|jgi:dephospho-CoA kinase
MIVGVTGTNGSGKGTVVDYLVQKGFAHYSARDFIVEEVQRRGLPVNRDTITVTANNLRELHGPAYVVEQLLARAGETRGDVGIESIRTVGEARVLKASGAILIGVDADPALRYERAVQRASVTDAVDFDTFVAQEKRELTSEDPNKQNVLGVMALADYTLHNDGTLAELHAQVDEVLQEITK